MERRKKQFWKKQRRKTPFILTGMFLMIVLIVANTGIFLGAFSDPVLIRAKNTFSKSVPLGVMATAVERKIAVSWEKVKGADGYEIYEAVLDKEKKQSMEDAKFTLIKDTKKCQAVFSKKKKGYEYSYYIRPYQIKEKEIKEESPDNRIYGKASKKVVTTVPQKGKSTIKNFLRTAIAPIGSTMYVWGGGWDKEDKKAGPGAVRIGLSDKWRTFSETKNSSYNYRNYRYQINNGLDCSGFVGWAVYNVMNTKAHEKGYVYQSKKQAEKFSKLGFGSYHIPKKVGEYRPGDIMSSVCDCCGHVWISLGQCSDGSVLLVHSSPSGVQISGTVNTKGKKNSKAYKLAKKYMKKYFPEWTKKYPALCKDSNYLKHYAQMRWDTDGKKKVLSDPDGYQKMSGEEVLKDLFSEW